MTKEEYYRKALIMIENPVEVLRQEAEKRGENLDIVAATRVAEDAKFLRQIAREALLFEVELESNKYPGTLEIDYARGVIYFHSAKTGQTMLRICGLTFHRGLELQSIDITEPDNVSMVTVQVHKYIEKG